MKYIQPRREDLYQKALNGPKKVLKQKDMQIDYFLRFTEWAATRYEKVPAGWITKDARENKGRIYTTQELLDQYRGLIGEKKATTQSKP